MKFFGIFNIIDDENMRHGPGYEVPYLSTDTLTSSNLLIFYLASEKKLKIFSLK